MSFVTLLGLTGTGKGSLFNHLEKLEASGYVTTKTIKTFGGYRTNVEITERGLEAYNSLLRALNNFQQTDGGPDVKGTV